MFNNGITNIDSIKIILKNYARTVFINNKNHAIWVS